MSDARNAKCPVSRNAKCEMPGFATAKFDEALRATLKVADDDGKVWAWGRQVMMEVLREELDGTESEDSLDEDS